MANLLKEIRKIYYTWRQLDNDRCLFIRKIRLREKKQGFRFKRIYGVPRGGLPLAVCLSHDLNLDLAKKLPVKCDRELIVCDEIADSGRTLSPVKKAGYFIVTIHKYSASIVEPAIWLHKKPDGRWIIYPWERTE